MRIYASKTALGVTLGVAFCAASCAAPRKATPPHGAPPASVAIRGEHVTLRTNLWLELHAALAAHGDYASVVTDDPEDHLFRTTAAAVANCESATCATESLGRYRETFERALPTFEWKEGAWRALAAAHAAFDERADGVLVTVSKDLGIEPGPVDVVEESPPPGAKALLTPLLDSRSRCFVDNTRIIDCVIVRALLAGKRRETDVPVSERFFTVVVVHAVALAMSALDAKHVSVDRRSVAIADPDTLAFVTREWRSGASIPDLERRLARDRASAPDAPASH